MLGIVILDSRSWTRLVSNVTEVLWDVTQSATRAMGEALWASMMQGHAPRLKWPHLVNSTDEDNNKENSTPMASSGKQSQLLSHCHMHEEGLDRMMGLMESQKSVQEQLLEEHKWANENHCLARCKFDSNSIPKYESCAPRTISRSVGYAVVRDHNLFTKIQ